jgi:hypothetical protein
VTHWLLIFTVSAIVDICWTKYLIATADRQLWRATAWSGAIVASGGVVVVGYTADHWLLIPAVLGAMVGTWLTIRSER